MYQRLQVVDGAADRHRVQPSRELGFAAELAQILPDAHPDFLADIAGGMLVADDGLDQAEGDFVVGLHQQAEGMLVAGLGARDEGAFGFGSEDIGVVGHGGAGREDVRNGLAVKPSDGPRRRVIRAGTPGRPANRGVL